MDTITLLDGTLLIGIQHALNADWLTPTMKAITYCGEGGYLWIAACFAMLLFKRTRRLGIICSLSLVITYICCNLVIKPSVDRIRPWVTFEEVTAFLPPPGDASFPSGHSANSMGPAWAMFLATCPVRIGSRKTYGETPCLGWKGSGADPRLMHRISIAAVVLSVLIGFSRLYLGMHYPTDVLCGLLLGMLCAAIVHTVIKKTEARRGIIGA